MAVAYERVLGSEESGVRCEDVSELCAAGSGEAAQQLLINQPLIGGQANVDPSHTPLFTFTPSPSVFLVWSSAWMNL